MEAPNKIYLEPYCRVCGGEDPAWSEVDEWGTISCDGCRVEIKPSIYIKKQEGKTLPGDQVDCHNARDDSGVGGSFMEGTIGNHVDCCEALIEQEQACANPNTSLIHVLCESVRMSREYTYFMEARISFCPTPFKKGVT